MILAICMLATCEGMILGTKAGVQPKTLFEIISKSSGQNWALNTYMPKKAFKGDFEPGFIEAGADRGGHQYGTPLGDKGDGSAFGEEGD